VRRNRLELANNRDLIHTSRRGRPPRAEATVRSEHLLDVAAELFLTLGYERTSVDMITRAAGASKQTIYARFPTKADLFTAVFRRKADSFWARFTRILADESPVEEALKGFASQVLEILTDPEARALRRVVISETPHFPELGRMFYELGPGRSLELLASFIQRKALAGELNVASPSSAAEQFVGLVSAGIIWPLDLGLLEGLSEEARQRRIDRTVAAFLKLYRDA
jgi:TetR/AcrR family transcriptional regulator, mexJK operon transcriptional repressor